MLNLRKFHGSRGDIPISLWGNPPTSWSVGFVGCSEVKQIIKLMKPDVEPEKMIEHVRNRKLARKKHHSPFCETPWWRGGCSCLWDDQWISAKYGVYYVYWYLTWDAIECLHVLKPLGPSMTCATSLTWSSWNCWVGRTWYDGCDQPSIKFHCTWLLDEKLGSWELKG